MTQERRRYGFVLERQCSLAKHYLAYHSQGSTVLQRHLEDWQEVAQTREFLPDAVEAMFNNRLRVSTLSHDGMSSWHLNVKNRDQLGPLSSRKFFSHLLFPPKDIFRLGQKSLATTGNTLFVLHLRNIYIWLLFEIFKMFAFNFDTCVRFSEALEHALSQRWRNYLTYGLSAVKRWLSNDFCSFTYKIKHYKMPRLRCIILIVSNTICPVRKLR
jgi:hypothetical protein